MVLPVMQSEFAVFRSITYLLKSNSLPHLLSDEVTPSYNLE